MWDITSAKLDSEELLALLKDDWEPFAAVPDTEHEYDSRGYISYTEHFTRVLLRRNTVKRPA